MLSTIFPMRTLAVIATGCALQGCAHDQEASAGNFEAFQREPIKVVQQPAPETAAPAAVRVPAKAVPAIDLNAITALEKMGAYLRTLKTFEIKAVTTTDEVLEGGQKLQFGGTVSMKVKRPNGLMAEIASDRKQRQIFYDGKTMTLYGPRVKYYASVAAPPTLNETAELLAKRYGIELPLADLFYWGTDQSAVSEIKSALYIGPATVDGVRTDHFAFRQEGTDWQIWIQKGNHPLPRKLVITSIAQAAQPEYGATLRWDTAARLDNSAFSFRPPPGAMRIALQTADGKVESTK